MQLGEFNILNIDTDKCIDSLTSVLSPFGYPDDLRVAIIDDNISALHFFKQVASATGIPLYYINTPISGIIQPEAHITRLPFSDPRQMLRSISPFHPQKFDGNEDMFETTVFVDAHGQIQIQGTHDMSMGINCFIPNIAACLGVLIKDDEGNITVSHHTITEQYSPDTILNDIERHQSSFGIKGKCLLSLAGLALRRGGLAILGDLPYMGLSEIDPRELQGSVTSTFPDTRFKFEFHPNKARKEKKNIKLHETDILTSNLAGAPVAVKQY